jgi:hypothetical protein
MRRTAWVVGLVLVLVFAPAAEAGWNSPPHDPPPPGGKLGLLQAGGASSPGAYTPTRPVPAGSGTGRRVVYSNLQQHVWIVEASGAVIRDYPVSGRRGLPKAGTYSVYSRSRVSRSGSLALNYMVRFARGRRLAIGFHEIPRRPNGSPIQSHAELGSPRSHGCVRQSAADAAFMWEWAQLGTVVVALP